MNNNTSEYDYVIVGAGSAGCVLANRLSADGKHSVLLLEAGPKDTNIWIHVPLGYGKLFKEKSVNWMYQTEPEPGLNGRQVFQPRGKVLGGSSSINGLLYVRGQLEDSLRDGVEVKRSEAAAGSFAWREGPLTIGADASGMSTWLGTVEALAIHGRPLDSDEIARNARAYRLLSGKNSK